MIPKPIDGETGHDSFASGAHSEEIKKLNPLGNETIQSKRSDKKQKQKHDTEENLCSISRIHSEVKEEINSIECSEGEGKYVKKKKRKKKAKKLAKKQKYNKDCELQNEEGYKLDKQDERWISEFQDVSDGHENNSVKEANFEKNRIRRKRTKNKKKKAEKESASKT